MSEYPTHNPEQELNVEELEKEIKRARRFLYWFSRLLLILFGRAAGCIDPKVERTPAEMPGGAYFFLMEHPFAFYWVLRIRSWFGRHTHLHVHKKCGYLWLAYNKNSHQKQEDVWTLLNSWLRRHKFNEDDVTVHIERDGSAPI